MRQVTVILHNIRSTHNVGSIFRTAEGFGATQLVLSGYTPYPQLADDPRLPHIANKLNDQIKKTSLGAELMVPFTVYETLEQWLEQNRQSDHPLPLYALEQDSRAIPLSKAAPAASFALLLGEEVSGIDPQYLELCDAIFEIPMVGQKESFNVSVAAGIALYQLSLL